MKLLFLETVGVIGGAERILLDLIASLRTSMPSITIGVITGAEGPLVGAARALGAEVTVLPLPPRLAALGDTKLVGNKGLRALGSFAVQASLGAAASASYVAQLRAAVRRFRPTVVHSNGMKMHVLAAAVCPRSVPLVWWMHDFLGERRIMAHVLGAAAGRADLAIAISDAVARDAKKLLRSLPVRVVYNATDTDHFVPAGDQIDLDALSALTPAPPETVRVGLVATYARWKGQDVFLAAAQHLLGRSALPPVRFYVIGGPIYETAGSQFGLDELRALASHGGRGLSDIGFIPFQSDPARAYRALDIVVHASTRPEPFGLTIVEAMSCGRAVIVARAGGAAELYNDGFDAIGVEPRDPLALADAIAALAVDRQLRERMGAAARHAAVERFARDRFAREMLAAYSFARETKAPMRAPCAS